MTAQDQKLEERVSLPQDSERLGYIDGIRGIASLFVVFCHLACVFLPQLYYYDQDSAISRIWINTPLNIITNGRFSVQWFFILSGFLITRKTYTRCEKAIMSPFKTYNKLLGIVAPAVIFAAILMVTGGMYHLKALELSSNLIFVADYNNFPVRFADVLLNIFLKPFLVSCDYVGPFWTIRYELLGSVIVAAVSWYACDNQKYSKWVYLLFAACFSVGSNVNLVAFMLGAFAYDCIYYMETDQSLLGRIVKACLTNKFLCGLAFVVGIYFATINLSATGLWKPMAYFPAGNSLVCIGGVAVMLVCICRMEWLQRILSVRMFRWLGSVSAFTYAFHWPITLSWGCFLFVRLYGKIGYTVLVALITVSVLFLSIAMAYVYLKLSVAVKRGLKERIKWPFSSRVHDKWKKK